MSISPTPPSSSLSSSSSSSSLPIASSPSSSSLSSSFSSSSSLSPSSSFSSSNSLSSTSSLSSSQPPTNFSSSSFSSSSSLSPTNITSSSSTKNDSLFLPINVSQMYAIIIWCGVGVVVFSLLFIIIFLIRRRRIRKMQSNYRPSTTYNHHSPSSPTSSAPSNRGISSPMAMEVNVVKSSVSTFDNQFNKTSIQMSGGGGGNDIYRKQSNMYGIEENKAEMGGSGGLNMGNMNDWIGGNDYNQINNNNNTNQVYNYNNNQEEDGMQMSPLAALAYGGHQVSNSDFNNNNSQKPFGAIRADSFY